MNRTACWLAALTLLSAHGACSDSSGPAADGSGARDGAAERRGDDGSLPPRDAAGDAPADAPGD
ncbi:MAG: hypothetical protein KC503_27210, partial [Myxococcales bacterium]|nr:hypothetical protein [Myxococcales bacterium]